MAYMYINFYEGGQWFPNYDHDIEGVWILKVLVPCFLHHTTEEVYATGIDSDINGLIIEPGFVTWLSFVYSSFTCVVDDGFIIPNDFFGMIKGML